MEKYIWHTLFIMLYYMSHIIILVVICFGNTILWGNYTVWIAELPSPYTAWIVMRTIYTTGVLHAKQYDTRDIQEKNNGNYSGWTIQYSCLSLHICGQRHNAKINISEKSYNLWKSNFSSAVLYPIIPDIDWSYRQFTHLTVCKRFLTVS